MSTTVSKKKYDDSAVDAYLENNNVYASSDLCIDIAAVIRYAREHGIALSAVPAEVVEQYTGKTTEKVS